MLENSIVLDTTKPYVNIDKFSKIQTNNNKKLTELLSN